MQQIQLKRVGSAPIFFPSLSHHLLHPLFMTFSSSSATQVKRITLSAWLNSFGKEEKNTSAKWQVFFLPFSEQRCFREASPLRYHLSLSAISLDKLKVIGDSCTMLKTISGIGLTIYLSTF